MLVVDYYQIMPLYNSSDCNDFRGFNTL